MPNPYRQPRLLLLAPKTTVAALLLVAASLVCAGPAAADTEARSQPSIGPPREAPTVDDLTRQGLGYTARGDLDRATEVWHRLRAEHPQHPAGPLLEINTLRARKAFDYQDTRYDAAIEVNAKEALRLSERWLDRAPGDPRAHFYTGQAKHQLMMLWGMRGRYYRAGTVGEEARKHLERSLVLDPSLVDAKLPLGTYYYWASVATRFIRWLTWLWFIPTGEHDLGLAYVEEVSQQGDLYRFDASVELAQMYLYFEDRPDLAEPIITRLHDAYPENSYLAFEMVELRMTQCDYPATIAKALAMEQGNGDQFGDAPRRTAVKTWRARAELLRGNADVARAIVDALLPEMNDLPPWGRRWLALTQGNLADLSGNRNEAVAHYERVIALKSRWESDRAVDLAGDYLRTPFRLCTEAEAGCDCSP